MARHQFAYRRIRAHYFKAGKLTTPIADRKVEDRFIRMTPAERAVYDKVEDYISSTYNAAAAKQKTAVGFVMTIYRRRLASSFFALAETLKSHLAAIAAGHQQRAEGKLEDDVYDNELDDELMDTDEAAALEREALTFEERSSVEALLKDIEALPPDTKLKELKPVLSELRAAGYSRVMVFTQYTDSMDFLREQLQDTGLRLMCYSGGWRDSECRR